MDIYFWLFAIGAGGLLWWFAFYATKQMRLQKNTMREEQAKKNLAELARQQEATEKLKTASKQEAS